MAAVAPASDQAAELIQKLSVDSRPNSQQNVEPAKKPPASKLTPANGVEVQKGVFQPTSRSASPQLYDFMDPNMCYLPNGYGSYYYGYDGTISEWDDYSRYFSADGGVEMPPALYHDNGSLMYHNGYGYTPYGAYPSPCAPVPSMGQDGHLYGAQPYQYPVPFYPPAHSTAPTQPVSFQADQGPTNQVPAVNHGSESTEVSKEHENGILDVQAKENTKGVAPVKPGCPSLPATSTACNGNGNIANGFHVNYPDLQFGYDGMRSPVPWMDTTIFCDGMPRPPVANPVPNAIHPGSFPPVGSHGFHTVPHLMGFQAPRPVTGSAAPGYAGRMYQNGRGNGGYNNVAQFGANYSYNNYWPGADAKFKPRGRGNGSYRYWNENTHGLNELSKGPRAGRLKNQKVLGTVTSVPKGQTLPIKDSSDNEVSDLEQTQYNRDNFITEYADAKFFVIKSYSEDDVHKSIKYSVWASTPNGNKKLDSAYKEAQEKIDSCPVFLFFSVNTSGQFVGLAEMVGPVDFNKSMEYWQQDKWNGWFPLKWHIVKDLPNTLVKHIILANNENKPVTNSRDCQEVELAQGLEMLKIFKEYASKNSILDDFGFYEQRQKTLQEKKAKQQQYQKQATDGKQTTEGTKSNRRESSPDGPKPTQSRGCTTNGYGTMPTSASNETDNEDSCQTEV